jgi:hypothetical protein
MEILLMIERIRLAIIFTAIVAPLFIGGNARAQNVAEFELGLTLADTLAATYDKIPAKYDTISGNIDTIPARIDTIPGQIDTRNNRAIGYDSSATDGIDQLFGEMSYPGGLGFGADFFFKIPDGDETAIDIRHKPATDSFSIDFKMYMSVDSAFGSIYWNPSQIPASVTGIWIRPYYSQTPIMDMKNNRIFTFSNDSLLTWGNFLIVTVFHNMQPHYIPLAGVDNIPANSGGLIASASVFPNPMPKGGALDLTLNEPAYVSISGYDAAGREVLRIERSVSSGENTIDLSGLANARGAIFLRVDAESGTRSEVKNIVVMKE